MSKQVSLGASYVCSTIDKYNQHSCNNMEKIQQCVSMTSSMNYDSIIIVVLSIITHSR